ncbi:MAG: thiazole synthase [Deltaproteobacteria bacterium]|nr:thiazole synthase [Deltaproteobacteria bacterium]
MGSVSDDGEGLGAPGDELCIAGRRFGTRLLLGTGKFASVAVMGQAIRASGAEIVTVALRRVDLDDPDDEVIGDLRRAGCLLLPNTSGARTAQEAIRLARLAASAGLVPWVKLEVTPDPVTLLPDPLGTLEAAKVLVGEGFVVLPYIQADPILARQLEDVGCATVMPLGSPIGTRRGLRTRDALEQIIARAGVPVVVDAGLGAPSDAALALELGAAAVLVNTAIATAADPVAMADAFRLGVLAGRRAFLAGMAPSLTEAGASSPLTGFLR